MKKIFFGWILLFVFATAGFCGKLEDFIDDFEYIEKNCAVMETLPQSSRYRSDFELRMIKAKSRAADLQECARKIGIRDITLLDSLTGMFQYISTTSNRNTDKSGASRNFYRWEVRRQIRYLNTLQFSYEKRSFVPTDIYRAEDNLLVRFSNRFKHCQEIANAKRIPSDAAIREYRNRYFRELQKLAREIDRKARTDKLKLNAYFDLYKHVDNYVTQWEQNISYFSRQREKGREYESRIRETDTVSDRLTELKLAADLIEKDKEYLLEAGFEMYEPGRELPPISGKTPDDSEAKLPASSGDAKENKTSSTPADRFEEYRQRKIAVYDSESRLNGVSQRVYDSYRALLPEPQAKELDSEREKMSERGYPPAFARGTALKIVHLKYLDDRTVCGPSVIDEILNANSGESKK